MDVLPLGHDTAVGLSEREFEAARETKVWMLFYAFLPFLWGSRPCDGHAGLEVEFRKLSRSVFSSFPRSIRPQQHGEGTDKGGGQGIKVIFQRAQKALRVHTLRLHRQSEASDRGRNPFRRLCFNYLHPSAGSIIVLLPRRHLAGKLFNLFSA